jgi:hypothetical protein
MLCPVCHGTRVAPGVYPPRPCPECQGMGEVHCCEGLVAQPGYEEEFPRLHAPGLHAPGLHAPNSPRPVVPHQGEEP